MAGGGSSKPGSGRKKANIQIIPLIDVVFFLLATFVLFTLSLNKIVSVPLDLPVAVDNPNQKSNPDNAPLVLQVTDAGIFFDKELITERELQPRLVNYVQQMNAKNKEPRILLAGDDRAKYGPTVSALDQVRLVGVKQVSIETTYRPTGK
ncbi:MAG: biopolymer transporter ExbD [Nibricoccus sp.]